MRKMAEKIQIVYMKYLRIFFLFICTCMLLCAVGISEGQNGALDPLGLGLEQLCKEWMKS